MWIWTRYTLHYSEEKVKYKIRRNQIWMNIEWNKPQLIPQWISVLLTAYEIKSTCVHIVRFPTGTDHMLLTVWKY